jgi:RocCOR-like putative regulator of kinase activity/DAPkinase-like Roc (Ras of Complex) protein/Leucine Rich Repeat (LRR) protein
MTFPENIFSKDKAYREAVEERIEETRRSGAKELQLSAFRSPFKLTELPESLKELTQLQYLYLANNSLTTLPNWLGELTQLKSLALSDNYLKAVPEAIGKLTQLQSLSLSTNSLNALPESMEQLTQLQSLYVDHNRLTKVPDWLGQLIKLQSLDLSNNQLTILPECLSKLTRLKVLDVGNNSITILPDWIGQLTDLQELILGHNRLSRLPQSLEYLKQIRGLYLYYNQLSNIPSVLSQLEHLEFLYLSNNQLTDLPASFAQLENLKIFELTTNPFNPELAEAERQGIEAVKAYLRAKGEAGPIILNEAKLILVGEGGSGKTCLVDALLDNPWQEHPSTHGIKINHVKTTDPSTQTEITLNAWDFGGQRVYRPTHQLFFSAPAVYLVVWKPREGSQAGQVKEWIQLVKRREPSAKILVVATHGGPQQRQPDIDRQELWDLFGKETVVDFFFVDSKPDEQGNRKGIDELKLAIAQVAASLPEVGRSVPKSFADVRQALQDKGAPYLPLREVLDICRAHNMDDEIARLFITISHRLGHLTHYATDPTLRDIVILRPDWLATAMSYVLDDEATRASHGLVKFSRLAQLWDDKNRADDSRYPATLHPIFLRLMERFDLSYRVADLTSRSDSDPISLVGQLVPDIRPQNISDAWKTSPASGDIQQTQICHIVDASNGQSASAEGLFYQLIVRLHKYSLGRADYNASVHWQRGLVLEDEYKSRAFLEHVGNDVRITVRSPYPEGLLGMLTREVKFLVESFWEGLRCDVMVPCIEPCGKHTPGTGLFEVNLLMGSKRKGKDEFPCSVCGEWQNIDSLLRNAPAAQPDVTALIFAEFAEVKAQIEIVRQQNRYTNQIHITGNVAQSNIIIGNENKVDSSINSLPIGQFDHLDDHTRRILSQVDKTYTDLLQVLTDEAKEGPRLFSFFPVDRSAFNPKTWIREKFRLVLWCEHSRLPLPLLNNGDMEKGVYDLELEREWLEKASPYLKFLISTLGIVLPVASSTVKFVLDETAYKLIEEQLDFGKSIIDATLGETAKIGDFLGTADSTPLEHGVALRSDGSTLRELHALLKAKDPGFGGLVRVMNKRQEFLWVHEKFAGEY